MRLLSLEILSRFRGLSPNSSFNFDNIPLLKNRLEPICLVGLNGSGKSNLLEVISEIFYYLDTYIQSNAETAKSSKGPFGFTIIYEMDLRMDSGRRDWESFGDLDWGDTNKALVKISKNDLELPQITIELADKILCNKSTNPADFVLPGHIISYSSGQNEMLSNPYIKSSYYYFDQLNTKESKSISEEVSLSRLFYLNYENSQLATICNYLFADDNNIGLLNRELKVEGLETFSFTIRFRNYRNNKIEFAQILKNAIQNLKDCATGEEEKEGEANFRELNLSFYLDPITKNAFRRKFGSALLLFRDLFFLDLMNIHCHPIDTRNKIKRAGMGDNLSFLVPVPPKNKLVFLVSDVGFKKNGDEEPLKYRGLSDGEHQLLHVLGGMMLLNLSGSLLLFDEPETHFNPEWRSKLISLINEATIEKAASDNIREQEIIITSHSPFIVSDCRRERVFVFKNGKAKNPEIKTFGTSVNLITMNIFGKTDTISGLSEQFLKDLKVKLLDKSLTKEEVINSADELGESIEKTMFFNYINKME